jgi:uncharacterized protein
MKVVDTNVLLYAANSDATRHEASRTWLDDALGGADTVGFTWVAMLAFIRLSSDPRLFPVPLTVAGATSRITDWTSAPGGIVVHPGAEHAQHLGRLLTTAGVAGNLVHDAHLAAIALEQRSEVVSYDPDFTRFADVRCHRPEDLI